MGGNIIVIVPDERFEQQKLYILSLQIAEGLGPNLSFQSYFAQKKITGQIGQIYQCTYQTIAGIFANYS